MCVCKRAGGQRKRDSISVCVREGVITYTLHNMNIFQDGSLLLDFSIILHICTTARELVFHMCMFCVYRE